jgi:DDE family transposase
LAAQRRRRARANARRDRALRLSERYLKLLDWTILLTNVTPEQLSAQQLLETYACRWQIEMLFKSWKSHFQLGRLPSSGPRQVQIQLLAKLLAIALVQNSFAPRLHVPVRRPLSPLKIAAYFSRLLPLIAASPHQNWFDHFFYFCRYDSRPNRPNFFEKLSSLCQCPWATPVPFALRRLCWRQWAMPEKLLRFSSYGASASGKRSRHSEATVDSAAFWTEEFKNSLFRFIYFNV